MADSDLVIPVREELRVGDVRYKAAISEAVFTRVAAQNNFINSYQVDYHSFFLNGSYGITSGNFGYDGAYTCFFNSEIVGVTIFNAVSGVSGVTDLDIRWINQAGIDQGSIFSTTPKIDSTSSNGTRGFRNLQTGNDYTMTGVTLPVLSKNTFLEGETLYLTVNGTMSSAQNCALTLNIRPIN